MDAIGIWIQKQNMNTKKPVYILFSLVMIESGKMRYGWSDVIVDYK